MSLSEDDCVRTWDVGRSHEKAEAETGALQLPATECQGLQQPLEGGKR